MVKWSVRYIGHIAALAEARLTKRMQPDMTMVRPGLDKELHQGFVHNSLNILGHKHQPCDVMTLQDCAHEKEIYISQQGSASRG